MTRKDDLEQHIRDAYSLIHECEDILRLSDRPKEKARARRAIEEQWGLIQEYLNEYLPLCRSTGAPLPADVRDILPTPKGGGFRAEESVKASMAVAVQFA